VNRVILILWNETPGRIGLMLHQTALLTTTEKEVPGE